MNVTVFTLSEGRYHYGVAALINSLSACGFKGDVAIYYKGDLPPWTRSLPRSGEQTFQVQRLRLVFKRAEIKRHLGYHKPFAALDELTANPDSEAVVYADPDILFLAPWTFFEEWLGMGVALCLDSNFPDLSENHPWRKTWKGLLKRATGQESLPITSYPNSGFFGVTRADSDFLRSWSEVTRKFEEEGGNTISFDLKNRHKPIVGDQDLLAATLMGWKKNTSILGQEGMGFTGHHFILAHNVGAPKPWDKSYVREALKGMRPTPGEALYLKFANGPLSPYSADELAAKQWDFRFAQLISRVWSR